MAENGRLADTHHIVEKFEELMMAGRGEVKAVVTSAEARANASPQHLRLCTAPRQTCLASVLSPNRAVCRLPLTDFFFSTFLSR